LIAVIFHRGVQSRSRVLRRAEHLLARVLCEDRSAGAESDRKSDHYQLKSEPLYCALSIIVYCLKHWFFPEVEEHPDYSIGYSRNSGNSRYSRNSNDAPQLTMIAAAVRTTATVRGTTTTVSCHRGV
jgi:hypothetical protein